MPDVSEDGPKTGGVLCSSNECGIFSFTCAGHDAGDDGGEGVNGAVDLQGQAVVAKEEVCTGDGSGVGT